MGKGVGEGRKWEEEKKMEETDGVTRMLTASRWGRERERKRDAGKGERERKGATVERRRENFHARGGGGGRKRRGGRGGASEEFFPTPPRPFSLLLGCP